MVRARLILALTLVLAPLLVLGAVSAHATPPLPQDAKHAHLGVASCASSVCHGGVTPKKDSNVFQNEFRTWTLHDRHARAYKTLLTEQSKSIALKLGLPNAHTAKVCLDCHTDNVAEGSRGRRFQLSDGVGCEGCHGGAEKWIESHTEPDASHADNIQAGLYPTDDPHARSQLCLSCHLGTSRKLAGHDIMGAGHPRLSFELDTFTVLQPEHYQMDDDYLKRKGDNGNLRVWVAGQFGAAERTLELLASKQFHDGGMFPEISFYDCHSCHHSMIQVRWQGGEGLRPGAMRLNDAYLQITGVLIGIVAQDRHAAWQDALRSLQKAATRSPSAVTEQANAMLRQLQSIATGVNRPLSRAEQANLTRRLLGEARNGAFRDYTSAEQVVMACSVLFTSLGIDQALSATLDKLYAVLEDEHRYDPAKLKTVAAQALIDVERKL